MNNEKRFPALSSGEQHKCVSGQVLGRQLQRGSLHSDSAALEVPAPWVGSVNRVLGALPDAAQSSGLIAPKLPLSAVLL